MKKQRYYIGISGWRYKPWRGVFYPEDLQQRLELNYASERMRSIEINGSFYSLQRPSSYQQWYTQVPDDFVFSVKCPRYITHILRLNNIEGPMANFYASGVLALQEKLGPFLWQFPPNLKYSPERFEGLFKLLPRTMSQAAELGSHYNDKLKAAPYIDVDKDRPLRHAIEIRNPSFMMPEFFEMLRQYDVAFVFADTAGLWPYAEDLTSNFCYCRLHGAEELYASGYSDDALDWWAERLKTWTSGAEPADAKRILHNAAKKRAGRDAFVYFDNDIKVHAPFDAAHLMSRLGVKKDFPMLPRPRG